MITSICILYGVNEGPFMGKAFRSVCEEVGWDVVSDVSNADIIFAHSGGCYLIPSDNHAKLVVLVGLPYWPGRTLLQSTAMKVWREWKHSIQKHSLKAFAVKCVFHVWYALDLKSTIQMAKQRGIDNAWNSDQRQIILHNRYDVYSSPKILQMSFKGPRDYISLTGEHDDCWSNPKTYVGILKSIV